MNHHLEKERAVQLKRLYEQESSLAERAKEAEEEYSGLKVIDELLQLSVVKLKITQLLLQEISEEPDAEHGTRLKNKAQRRAQDGLRILEELVTATISSEEKQKLIDSPEYQEAKTLFYQLLFEGGAALFEDKVENKKKANLIARTVTNAIEKFIDPDDNYQQLFKSEELTPFWRRLVQTFFFILSPEYQHDPPYGIEEGEEQQYSAEHMTMPLSQAIFYYENEVLPMLEELLAESPGDKQIQQKIDEVRERVQAYKDISLKPRSQPLVMPKDYYTEGITHYTRDGEPLVSVSLPVTFDSKTNLDRMQELVEYEITRGLAGKGVCPELDKEYDYLKSIKSGTRGDSRFPSLKLRMPKGFLYLKNRYPLLKKVDNKREFKQLVRIVRMRGRKALIRKLEKELVEESRQQFPQLE